MASFPLFAIGERLITIVETRPDCFRYYDEIAGEVSGGAFDGTRVPLAIAHLTALELNGSTNQQTTKG